MTAHRAGANRPPKTKNKHKHAGVLKLWDHVNGGELRAIEVRSARRLEVEYLNKMKVVERVAVSRSSSTGLAKRPIKVRWVGHSEKPAGYTWAGWWRRSFRRGSQKPMASWNFSAPPLLEVVKTDDIDGGNRSVGPGGMVLDKRGHEKQFRDRDDVHGRKQSVLSRSMQRRENMFELPREM